MGVNTPSLELEAQHNQNNHEELIEVFRMNELSPIVRAKVIIELGRCINAQLGANITEALVFELVKILDPGNDVLMNPHYMRHAGVISMDEYKERLKQKQS